jgi:hypothetical protein
VFPQFAVRPTERNRNEYDQEFQIDTESLSPLSAQKPRHLNISGRAAPKSPDISTFQWPRLKTPRHFSFSTHHFSLTYVI